MKFTNKVVVITGAGGGIGRAIATRFLAEGAKVCAADMAKKALDQVAADLGSPDTLMTAEVDISSEESCQNLYEQVKQRWGAVDILVNNAGKFPFTPFEEITYAEWRQVCSINLDGTFLMVKAMLPLLKESGAGRIINMASGSWYAGPAEQAHYVAAKAGVLGFTRSIANALGQYNITVNAVTPGFTATPGLLALVPMEMLEKEAQRSAIKRVEEPEDLVGPVLFLASEDAAFMTGQTINVDGGHYFN